MAKRALLVGCNYPGTNAELRGCINDVTTMREILTKYFDFADNDITIMIDTDKSYTQPTGRNIKAKLAELVQVSQSGDVLFFHFSGHGTQVPTAAEAGEKDGKDEAICPTDMNVICDDDLKTIFSSLNPGCKFTMVADCCHSGTLLDHDEVIISGPKAGSPPPPQLDIGALAGLFGLKELDLSQDSGQFKNRSLPFDQLSSMLSQMLGLPVNQNNVRSAMTSLFGGDASARAINALQMGMMLLQSNPSTQKYMGCLGALMSCFGGGAAAAQADQPANVGTSTLPPSSGGAHAVGAEEPKLDVVVPPPVTVPGKMPEEVGILITGCQSAETSADACPSGDPKKAFGALTNGIRGVVDAHFQQNPGQPLTYRNLVIGVRESLGKGGFAQNPCLECHKNYADTAFITQF